jgi:DNA mismatch repair protein MutL
VTIQVLPPELQRLIAAGEVVERPASAVKELIENAIDARARTLSIDIRDGGLASIRVSDDGTGMSRADAPLSLERFSTSKIASPEDLAAIRTLGFRGEALSSIAAAADVEIVTRTEQEIEGTRVIACGRQSTSKVEIDVKPAASPVGTSVTVRGLYAQLPARRRFLKSRLRETEVIQNVTAAYALCYPQIAFRLVVDGRERLVAPSGTLLARIGAVLGHDVASEMVPVKWHALDLSVQGYVSQPTLGRSRRDAQHIAVNGRPVRPGLLSVMLERPYAGRLPIGRHPIAVLDIRIDPRQVDVNVHPRKAEVRYAQERTVYHAVQRAVDEALYAFPAHTDQGAIIWPFSEPGGTALADGAVPYAAASGELRALAQLHHTYILAQTIDGLAIADQHAAHEQVLYELLNRASPQVLLSPPARLDLTAREVDTLERLAPLLDDLGIEIEPFGGRSFLVRTLPKPLQGQPPAELVLALIEEGATFRGGAGAPSADNQRDRLAMKAACLSAIKAGDPLPLDQAQRLLDDLAQVWSPATCPHGRPALVSISMEELAQRFGR